MEILALLVNNALKQKKLSLREASSQIGISTTTLSRIANGEIYDMGTLLAICNWLGVMPSSVTDAEAGDLASILSALLEQYPEIKDSFEEAANKIIERKVSPETVKDLAAYIVFRVGIENEEK